jgi:hypothetical protein
MNANPLLNVMNQKKLLSHMAFLLFSLLFAIGTALAGRLTPSVTNIASVFILIFLQLEVFIFFGNILFAKVNFDQSPGVITRIVLFRFAVFISLCLLGAMILYLILNYALKIINGESLSGVIYNFFNVGFSGWFRSTISGLSAGALIFVVLLWQTSLRREQKLREENLIFQNQTLRNQVNPHFLFNSLNTLSALIPAHPDSAERFILKLSSIYRYILENSSKDTVPLDAELDFIFDYYFLHAIRDDGKIVLNVDAAEAEKFQILPVSLQILIENAIKHNIATRENPLQISIRIDDQMVIVRNNLQKMNVRMKSTGIGLNNLRERVRLTTGKNLVVEETKSEFIVKIPLNV